MAKDTSVMTHDENDTEFSFDDNLYKEYQQAVAEGFSGTKEEYYQIRDYT